MIHLRYVCRISMVFFFVCVKCCIYFACRTGYLVAHRLSNPYFATPSPNHPTQHAHTFVTHPPCAPTQYRVVCDHLPSFKDSYGVAKCCLLLWWTENTSTKRRKWWPGLPPFPTPYYVLRHFFKYSCNQHVLYHAVVKTSRLVWWAYDLSEWCVCVDDIITLNHKQLS